MWPAGGESPGHIADSSLDAQHIFTAERQRGERRDADWPAVHLRQTEVFFTHAEEGKTHNCDSQEADWGVAASHLQADRERVGRLVYSAE